MTAPRAPLAELPDWPRLLSADAGAAYTSTSVPTFESWARQLGVQPIRHGKRKLYDRRAIDAALDRLSGTGAASGREIARRMLAYEDRREKRQPGQG